MLERVDSSDGLEREPKAGWSSASYRPAPAARISKETRMFTAVFEHETTFSNVHELRAAFSTDRLYLEASAAVVFRGRIALGPEVSFGGNCRLADCCSVEQGSILTDVSLGEGSRVRAYSILSGVQAGRDNLFGPFCFLRDGCVVADRCILGAHVEAARSSFASGVKISHRAFVGDAEIGEESIVGAGVVFCNWDGAGRQPTRVGARVMIGSGVMVVPPLAMGDGVLIAAGSTISKDVPSGAKIIQKR